MNSLFDSICYLEKYYRMPAVIESFFTCLITYICRSPLRRPILIFIFRLSPEKQSCSLLSRSQDLMDEEDIQRSQFHSKLKRTTEKKINLSQLSRMRPRAGELCNNWIRSFDSWTIEFKKYFSSSLTVC